MDGSVIFYALAGGSVFLLSFVTFAGLRGVNATANKWLGVFLFSFGCVLLDRILPITSVYQQWPHLSGLTELSRFDMAPAMYLAVLHFTTPNRTVKKADWLHFIPFLLFLLYSLPFLLQGADKKLLLLTGQLPVENPGPFLGVIMFGSIKVQAVLYWILSYRRLIGHQKHVELFTSSIEPIKLNWLKNFLLGLGFMVLLWFNELFFKVDFITAFMPFGYLAATYFIGYFSLRQEEIFPFAQSDQTEIGEIIRDEDKPAAVRQPRVLPGELTLLKDKLLHLMDAERVYLDADLGLPQLAARMNITPHTLSAVLNEGIGKNFFQFINEYRVEEAKRLLLSQKHRHLSMVGIAYEAGFRSKTTFNTTFKKFTGESPTGFQRAKQKTNAGQVV